MVNDDSRSFVLPPIPTGMTTDGAVAVWEEEVTIDTYEPGQADRYPQYLDQRVYQGSSGRVYPMPFIESVSTQAVPRRWRAIHMVTQYVRLMILPELGGRIYHAEDLTKGYNFFYRNNVIKPALVGVLGPWISGGVEFNWPQHHRPATYLPTDYTIEREEDGAITVWCSDLSPFERLKGMHGVRLRPDSSLIELRVRLHNRTDDVQTFLWWANVAAPVGENYQSFFPTDVHVVADHAKRAITTFPRAQGSYYGVDYPARVTQENPDADRIDWYRNIPVPTSYMCLGSQDDFFGGYDHGRRAGFVHIADHHIAPGKKQWTWGNHRFGWAWDRNLTDSDGPYVELMAGVYTDNQPDFSYLAPGETKSFSQYWYPIQDIGCATQANTDLAVRFVPADAQENTDVVQAHGTQAPRVYLGVVPSRDIPGARIEIRHALTSDLLWQSRADLRPGRAVDTHIEVPSGSRMSELRLHVYDSQGHSLLEWTPRPPLNPDEITLPEPATESPKPEQIASTDELYLAGLHLYQYRHATRRPEDYWLEALRRDPGDYRVNVMMARLCLQRGQLEAARDYALTAVQRLTWRNPNPYDSEAYYVLGRIHLALEEDQLAYDAFAKAAWSAAWKAQSWEEMARIDLRRGRVEAARDRAEAALRLDMDNLERRNLLAVALERAGQLDEARGLREENMRLDPLDPWTHFALTGQLLGDAQVAIDVALELISVGEYDAALQVLDCGQQACAHLPQGQSNPAPLLAYHRWDVLRRSGRQEQALAAHEQARAQDTTCAFPGRLADALVLQRASTHDRPDPVASGLLGHWLWAAGRQKDAIDAWAQADQKDPVILRNLGVGAVNDEGDMDRAVHFYDAALALAGDDERLLYERDQLAARVGEPIHNRRERLEARRGLVARRSDLTATLARLRILDGEGESGLALLRSHVFQPWEGGEGVVLAAWEEACQDRCRRCLDSGNPEGAVQAIQEALEPPHHLGEDRHLLANCADLDLMLGDALQACGRSEQARQAWERAAGAVGDFVSMAPTQYSDKSYYSALALQRLGRGEQASQLAQAIAAHARASRDLPAQTDYFATSLPSMLLFHEDVEATRDRRADLMEAQALSILGEHDRASALAAALLEADPANVRARELLRPRTQDAAVQ